MMQWFARRLKETHKNQGGFTLVELLVVLIIIGILAAIAIPVFLNQRQNANQAACRSDVRNGATAANTYASNQPNGSYAGMTPAILQAAPYSWNLSSQSSNPQVTVTGGGNGFTLSVNCANAPAPTYTFDSATGRVTP